ncbi:SLATT domain-containing protein [Raoultella terrigena]|uniref:SLATT domain-containing protein n=1 Tax=Raoultella terrigena TaxID=577 RepID=UPI001F3CFF14|nr:SLATT domain-containing protein [Raoultella terrigena]
MGTATHRPAVLSDIGKLSSLNQPQKLDAIFKTCNEYEENIIGWYQKEVKKKRWLSLLFLFMVIAAITTIAAIQIFRLPFMQTETDKLWLTQISLGLLTIAMLLFVADRVFRLTDGWMYYIRTIIAIETRYAEFISGWIQNDAASHADADQHYINAAGIAAAFINDIHRIQQQETQAWSSQLTESIGLLGSLLKEQQNGGGQRHAAPEIRGRGKRSNLRRRVSG